MSTEAPLEPRPTHLLPALAGAAVDQEKLKSWQALVGSRWLGAIFTIVLPLICSGLYVVWMMCADA